MSLSISSNKIIHVDSNESVILARASNKACINAIKNSKKMGLPITFLEDGIVYRELPNGERVKMKKIRKGKKLKSKIVIRKGTILNAKF